MELIITQAEEKAVAKLIPKIYKKFHPDYKIAVVDEHSIYVDITTEYGETRDSIYVHGAYAAVVALRREKALKKLGI